MNIEEAIELIEMLDKNDDLGGIHIGKDIKHLIIDLLKRGEKFEKMFNKLEEEFESREQELVKMIKELKKYKTMWEEIKTVDWRIRDTAFSVKKLEQKYFPKE